MPEGPEIYIYAQYLDQVCKGRMVLDVTLHQDSKFKDCTLYSPIRGKTIEQVSSKGKKIIFAFEDKSYLISSLGLEGSWIIGSLEDHPSRHLSVDILLSDDGNGGDSRNNRHLMFYDTRHFGCLDYCKDFYELQNRLKAVGPSWIPSKMFPYVITPEDFYGCLQSKRLKTKPIMEYLMEQKHFSGVGNYIRADALYLARISPHRYINDISETEALRLFEAINQIMETASKLKGHSLRTYRDPEGSPGGYEPIVYGRDYSTDLHLPVVRESDRTNRTIHWVPDAQV